MDPAFNPNMAFVSTSQGSNATFAPYSSYGSLFHTPLHFGSQLINANPLPAPAAIAPAMTSPPALKMDYSVYMITDSSADALRGRDLVEVVRMAIHGGATMIRYRDTTSEMKEVLRVGKALHDTARSHLVPLIIHNRLDAAIAVGADGVHLEQQDDNTLFGARNLLGPDAIIGVSVSTAAGAVKAAKGKANYVEIGPVFSESIVKKENVKTAIGTAGVKNILTALSAMDEKVYAIASGGIDITNAQCVVFQSKATFKSLDGVAVSRAIMSAPESYKATQLLKAIIKQPPAFAPSPVQVVKKVNDLKSLLKLIPDVVKKVRQKNPLCHNMTNLYIQNFASNAGLAVGANPVMSLASEDAKELAAFNGSLVINMGSVTLLGIGSYITALHAYNAQRGPVLLDPVGCGVTEARKAIAKRLLSEGNFTVIKGNQQEIEAIYGEAVANTNAVADKAELVKKLALREKNVILMTGVIDYLSDGERTFAIGNGHEFLASIVGSGCTLGTVIAACLAVEREDKFLAVLAAVMLFEIASQHAGLREDVKGPGTFAPALIDELYRLSAAIAAGQGGWLSASRIKVMDV